MEIVIDGERTKLPDDDDLTLGESELVAKHMGIDLGSSLPGQKFMGLVFIAIHRKDPYGAIVDQVDAVRKMKFKDLDVVEEDTTTDPLSEGFPANGSSETILDDSGVPV